MKVTAKLNNLRISPRKVRESADLVRGCDADEALYRLENNVRRSSESLSKLIKSAVANAENNFGLNKDNLYICEITVDEGPTMKRWMPRAYGRATQILKRTSKVNVALAERDVKSKDQSFDETQDKKEKTEESKEKESKKVPTEGSKKTKERVVDTKKDIAKDNKIKHKKVEGSQDRQLSREPGTTKKIFKKTSDKK